MKPVDREAGAFREGQRVVGHASHREVRRSRWARTARSDASSCSRSRSSCDWRSRSSSTARDSSARRRSCSAAAALLPIRLPRATYSCASRARARRRCCLLSSARTCAQSALSVARSASRCARICASCASRSRRPSLPCALRTGLGLTMRCDAVSARSCAWRERARCIQRRFSASSRCACSRARSSAWTLAQRVRASSSCY